MESLLYIADADKCREVVDCLLDQAPIDPQMPRTEIKSDLTRDLLRVFSQATSEVLATIAGTDALAQETFLVDRNLRPLGEITSSIALSGEIDGSVAVSFNPELAAAVSARIAGCNPADLSDADVRDGVGEITNQVAGRARTLLSLRDRNIEIDLPQFGQEPHQVDICDHPVPSYAILFECLGQRFALQFCISEK